MTDKNKPVKKLLTWVCAVAIAIITYFVFSPSMDDGFTNWDDPVYVQNNPLVVTHSVPLVKIFETPVSLHYHPLTVLSLALNYQSGNLNPYGYHLENVILHVLNTILVFFFIFLLMRRNLLMAVIVSLFFGIHPMHVESVTWISERKDVLYVFFFMGGLITYLQYSEARKVIWYFFTVLLFILSSLLKEMAIVFPVILFLIDYLRGVKWERRLFIEKIPFVVVAVMIGIVESKIQSGNAGADMQFTTGFQRIMFGSYAAIVYIVRLFVPYKLSAFYPTPNTFDYTGIPLIFYFSPFILAAILGALFYLFLKKQKEIVFGLLFYFVTVVLVLQFIPINPGITPDRYSYLCYIGLLFVVAHLINKVWQSKNKVWTKMKYPFIVITIIGAMIFSYQSYSRTQVWKNSETLWTNVIDNYPTVSEAYQSRALYYISINENGKALADYDSNLQLNPFNKDVYYNRAVLYSQYYNKNNLAIADYSKTISIDPTYKQAYYNRALLYSNEGKYDSALADYNNAIKIDPSFANAFINRGNIYYGYGKSNLARADFTKAIELDSTAADAYNGRGTFYLNFGNKDLALADYNKAIALNPNSATYYYSRGLYYTGIKQYQRAANDFTRALQLNPQNATLYNLRGVCYANLQYYDEAINDFSKAIELNPSVARFYNNRSFVEGKTGQNEMAKADALRGQQLRSK